MSSPYELNLQIEAAMNDPVPVARIEQAVTWVLQDHECAPGTGLSVVVSEDEFVRELNRQYRGIDAPTDVLSFPAELPPGPEASAPYLGDLILGLPTIQRHAVEEEHAWADELVLAVVHGALHLLGYDHDCPARQSRMWAAQARALEALGVAIVVPEFDFEESEAACADDAAG